MSNKPEQYWPDLPEENTVEFGKTSHKVNKEYKIKNPLTFLRIFKGPFFLGCLVVIIIAIVLLFTFTGKFTTTVFEEGAINTDGWQAVFMNNEQVYFGRLELKDDIYVLSEIYYLQVDDQSQVRQDVLAPGRLAQPDIRLIKLGDELHGPEDVMYIMRSNVLYWENLRDNSRVVESIRAFEDGK